MIAHRQAEATRSEGAAVMGLGAGILLARRITHPVDQLAALARGVVEGNLSTRVRVAARDEIGMLANVFHLMVDRLQVSNRSLTEVLVRALEARGGESGSLPRLAKAAMALAERLEVSPTRGSRWSWGRCCTTSARSGRPRRCSRSPDRWRRKSVA